MESAIWRGIFFHIYYHSSYSSIYSYPPIFDRTYWLRPFHLGSSWIYLRRIILFSLFSSCFLFFLSS